MQLVLLNCCCCTPSSETHTVTQTTTVTHVALCEPWSHDTDKVNDCWRTVRVSITPYFATTCQLQL